MVFAVIDVALIAVERGRARCANQDLRGIDLVAEQTLADLVRPIGPAADVGIDVALADQILAGRLLANTDAGGQGGVEHPDEVIAAPSTQIELDRPGSPWNQRHATDGQGEPRDPQAQNGLHRSPPLTGLPPAPCFSVLLVCRRAANFA